MPRSFLCGRFLEQIFEGFEFIAQIIHRTLKFRIVAHDAGRD